MGSSNHIVNPNGVEGLSMEVPPNTCVVVEYLARGTTKSYLIKKCRRKLNFFVVIHLALDLS